MRLVTGEPREQHLHLDARQISIGSSVVASNPNDLGGFYPVEVG